MKALTGGGSPIEFLDLDQRGLSARALREARGSLVEREHVRVAVLVETADHARFERVVPCASRDLDHAAANVVGHNCSGENRAAIVENPDHIAVANSARGRIVAIHPHRLAPRDFALLADAPHVHLAVQTRARLRGQKMQRVFARRIAAQPLGGLEPGGMSGAIFVVIARNFF